LPLGKFSSGDISTGNLTPAGFVCKKVGRKTSKYLLGFRWKPNVLDVYHEPWSLT
jgi:hypothetical protein